MAKRVRANRSAHRPGGKGPSRSGRSTDTEDAEVADVTAATPSADIDEAMEAVVIETTEISIEDPVAPVAAATAATTRRGRRSGRRGRSNTLKADSLQARSTAEDAWIREDLRRIGLIALVLLVSLATTWVVLVAVDVFGLY